MTNSKATKQALFMSVVALLLCFTMLMGATFAWFTDTEQNTGNRIQAGNLDVDLIMDKGDGNGYVSIAEGEGDIFNEAAGGNGFNWEPGKTQIVYLGVRNNGSLALKYNIDLNIEDEGLIGSLEYAILDGVKSGEIEELNWAALTARDDAQTGDVPAGQIPTAQNGLLDEIATAPDASNVADADREVDYFALAVHMKETAGNEYQGKGVKIDILLKATQVEAEFDSFGNDYDSESQFPIVSTQVSSPDRFLAMLAKPGNNSVILTDDIDGAGIASNGESSINLNGYTLSIESAREGYSVIPAIKVNSDLNIFDGTISTTKSSSKIELRPDKDSTYTFRNVIFDNKYKGKTSTTSYTDRIEEMVRLVPVTAGVKTTMVFENCEFNNASVVLNGLSGTPTELDVTFKNCTFNALMSSDRLINVGNYFTGNINIEDCTFNIEGTNSNQYVIAVSNSSDTTVIVNAENNTLNANAAVAHNYDASIGETEVDTIRVTSYGVKNYYLFDLRQLSGGYSTINETGTVIKGDIALESIKRS